MFVKYKNKNKKPTFSDMSVNPVTDMSVKLRVLLRLPYMLEAIENLANILKNVLLKQTFIRNEHLLKF